MDLKTCLITLEFILIFFSFIPEDFISRSFWSGIMLIILIFIINI